MKEKIIMEELYLGLHKESEHWDNILKAYVLRKRLKIITINLGSTKEYKKKMQILE